MSRAASRKTPTVGTKRSPALTSAPPRRWSCAWTLGRPETRDRIITIANITAHIAMHKRMSPITITVAISVIMDRQDHVNCEGAVAVSLGGNARGKRGMEDPRTCP